MSLIIPANTLASGGYAVDNSCRFNDDSSDYLNRTGGTATDGKKFTYSAWFKRSEIGGGNELFCIYADNTNRLFLRNNGDTFELNLLGGFGSTTRQFRDPSAWYHFVIACDSTQATASDRGKWYLNGELIMTGSISLNQVFPHGQSTPNFIIGNGEYNNTIYSVHWDGYQSEVCFIDGQQLDATSFGEFDADSGIWKPIDVSELTFGTNGFYLDFEDSAALGADVSGNTNNFTVNNLTAIDQTTDTPTNNFCTLNPLDVCDADGRTLSNGNLDFNTSSGNNGDISGTLAASSGKWYFETKILAQSGTAASAAKYGIVGVKDINVCSFSAGDAYYIFSDGRKEDGVTATSSVTPGYSTNDIVQVALDLDGGNIYFGLNGDWGDNAGNFNQTFVNATAFFTSISTSKFWTPYLNKNVTADNVLTLSANFGNAPYAISSGNTDGNGYGNFEYAVPSGYYSLNTKNLSEFG
jgi:hypothetical protein